MSIYIKGMEMPTNCTDCRYRPLVGCNPYQDDGLSPSEHRHRTCPLTEVKEPHGRLIDADALVGGAEQYELEGGTFCIDSVEDLYAWLYDDAPTVIERSDK